MLLVVPPVPPPPVTFTVTVQVAFWPLLVTVTVLLPLVEYWVAKLAPLPEVGVPFGADQENVPLPPVAVKLAF